jgi:Leucine-rich repeat (LRR) protein
MNRVSQHCLDSLGLERNELVGSIPSQFGLMRNLRNLALDFNQLTGTVPSQLFQLQGLGESTHLLFTYRLRT